jgi:hypothetical protein
MIYIYIYIKYKKKQIEKSTGGTIPTHVEQVHEI